MSQSARTGLMEALAELAAAVAQLERDADIKLPITREVSAGKFVDQGLVIDYGSQTVTLDNEAIELTSTEYNVLEALSLQVNRIMKSVELTWYAGRGSEVPLDSVVRTLHSKLGRLGNALVNCEGKGYVLRLRDGVVRTPYAVPPEPLQIEICRLTRRLERVILLRKSPPADFRFKGEGLELDFAAQSVWWHGKQLPINPTPLRILTYLVTNRNNHVSRQVLCEYIWPGTPWKNQLNAINLHIFRLRRLLGQPTNSGLIKGTGGGWTIFIQSDEEAAS